MRSASRSTNRSPAEESEYVPSLSSLTWPLLIASMSLILTRVCVAEPTTLSGVKLEGQTTLATTDGWADPPKS